MTEELSPYNAGITKEEFLTLLWRFEELMVELDYLRGKITNCKEGCDEEDNGLCPACCEVFEKVRAEEDRLEANKEFNEVMKKLKKACDEDKTEGYERIFKQSREGKVVH